MVLVQKGNRKYKLEKGQPVYAIDSIPNKVVYATTKLLAGKVMQKCRSNEVPKIVVEVARWSGGGR